MINWIEMAIAVVGGATLGLFYFGGLWWTVKHSIASKRPASFYLVSFAARMTVVVACVILVLKIGTLHLLFGVAGFFAARLLIVYFSSYLEPVRGDAKVTR